MKGNIYREFGGSIRTEQIKDPFCKDHSVIIQVKASGLCRSDWHGWMGHDNDIILPHVPGHEFAGIIVEKGKKVKNYIVGDRVTVPFVCACGTCPQCYSGNQQVCNHQTQPGFTHWGSFAEYVRIDHADINLVDIPEEISFETAAVLGCRFITSYRAVLHQGKLQPGQTIAIFGCGGVGLSAIMIAKAINAKVIAIDINYRPLILAKELGADVMLNSNDYTSISDHIIEITRGGVDVSIDALGSMETCFQSIASLKKRAKHIQVGLLAGKDHNPPIPMSLVIAKELEILGSHGMQAHKYPEMMNLIRSGTLKPERLIENHISLEEACDILPEMGSFNTSGVWLINTF